MGGKSVRTRTGFDLRVLSLGAGVQSTTLYLMAVEGELEPLPDVAIFADTQAEPPWVYSHLWELAERFGDVIPIRVVTQGNLASDVLHGRPGRKTFPAIPAFVASDYQARAILRRQCTREYKLEPIYRGVREALGLRPRQRINGVYLVEQWVGISADEASRMKHSRKDWAVTRWPLIERLMTREDCKRWLTERGYPLPKRSACYFCPFRSDSSWAEMKELDPETFQAAVAFDEAIRTTLPGVISKSYLHQSLRPLGEVDFQEPPGDQLELGFHNECEGMCGV